MRKIYIFILLAICGGDLLAQEVTDAQVQQISPLTPNAVSLGKFGDVPVSLYTGIPNVQIPIYEISIGDFRLPISINYHARGIKVDDVPSWVGMGWALNAGGVINRQQRGVQDEKMIEDYSSFETEINTILDPNASEVAKETASLIMAASRYDTESDQFYMSAGNLSQSFFLDPDGNVYCKPVRNLKIVPEGKKTLNGSDYYYFERWTVTDENGIQYIFGKTLDNSKTEVEITQEKSVCIESSDNQQVISSWYLNEIKLPSGQSMTFTYDYFSCCIENNVKETFILDAFRRETVDNAIYYSQVLRLKEINFPAGKVEFIAGDERRDISGMKILDKIKIYSYKSGEYQETKTFLFNTNNPAGNTTSDDLNFRLALLSIAEVGENGEPFPLYIFDYNKLNSSSTYNFGLPSRGSYAQDLWGYFNGALDNETLIPNFVVWNDDQITGYIEGANRAINPDYTQAGMLTKITYPTGGNTQFFYENNIARGAIDENDPNAVNPLNLLVSMDALDLVVRTNNIQLENTNGYDIGYSQPFQIFHEAGRNVDVGSHIMYYDYDNQCTVTSPPGADGSFFECMDITIQKESSPGIFVDEINTVYFGRYYRLYPGIYRIKLSWHDLTQIGSWGYVDLSWEDLYAPRPVVDETTELKVGGLRIAKIIDYDPVTGMQNTRNFNYEFNQDDSQQSGTSGTVQDVPLHFYSKSAIYYLGEWIKCENCVHLTSYSNAPILQTQGGHVGYKKVTVGFGKNNAGGKQVSYFLSLEDYPDENIASSHLWPFPRVTDYDWRRGNLLNEKSYELLSNQSFGLKKSVLNQYQFNNSASDNNYKKIINVKVDKRPGLFWDGNQMILVYSGCYSLYNTATESFYLTKSSNSIKTAQGDIATETTFEHDHDMYLGVSSTLTTNSNEEALRVLYKYAYDYDNVENFDVLESNNIIAKPIDVRTYNNAQLISGTQTKYDNNGQPVEVRLLERKAGDPDIPFNPADPYTFNPKVTYSYNPQKNIKQVSPVDNFNTAFLWDATGTYVMAKVENVTYSQISSQDGKTCTYNSLTLYNSLKTLVPDAMITTYTYKPLVGITQQTDPTGRTTYYEYDGFGRLKLVRDQNNNIISKNEYHYASQQ